MAPPKDVQDSVSGFNKDQAISNTTPIQGEYKPQQEPTRTRSVKISKPSSSYIPDMTGNRYEVNFNFEEISNEVMTYDWITAGFMHKLFN